MRGLNILSGLVAATLFASSVVAVDLDPIIVKGSKFFFKSNGTQFFMRGIAYQQQAGGLSNGTSSSTTGTAAYKDPLADATRCQIDIPLMAKLRTNVIRVYAVDPSLDHSVCMNLLVQNNIYIVADLSEPGNSINRDTPQWNDQVYERYTKVVDMFSGYTNVIGFFAGNEVSNQLNNTNASAFVKAAVRDTKSYIKSKNYRQMYVGYATSDDANIRENMANYFNCGNADEAIDFWGYNIYSWCGDSSYTLSGYDQRVAEFSKYSVPSFFAEYGCNTPSPRNFTEVQALYGSNMTNVFSGGIVYMYFQEENNYGLVDVTSGTASLLPDYSALSSQMAVAEPTGTNINSYTPSNTAQACPAVASGVWDAKASPLPPTPNKALCSCMYNSLSCAVKGTVATTAYGSLFGTICGFGGGAACAGIQAKPLTGQYGAYSMCNATEQLSFALDQYYKSQNLAADACNFQGAAGIKTSVSPPSSCSALMQQAGTNGVGTVAASAGAASSGSSKKGAAASASTPGWQVLLIGLYSTVAAIFGAGLILM